MVERLDAVFHALSDPTRRAILADLAAGERSVGELASPYRMSLAAVSKHLGVLERAGLVKRRSDGRKRLCRLEPARLADAQHWLARYERFWAGRLDALARELEEERK